MRLEDLLSAGPARASSLPTLPPASGVTLPHGSTSGQPVDACGQVRDSPAAPATPAMPGREARRENEYERCGTANVFCAVEPKAGRHFTFATPDRSGFECSQVAVTLALAYPEARLTVSLVQCGSGFSAWSMTSVSTVPLEGSSFNPVCS